MGAQMMKDPSEMRAQTNVPGVSTICDNCGRVFCVDAEITNRTYGELKMRCERCAAKVVEDKVSTSPFVRKCGTCQGLFSVSQRIAEMPSGVVVNCQRCSDTRRSLVSNGTYLEVALQKGDEKLYICCPRNMQGEMRKYMSQCKQQGYSMVMAPDDQP